MVKKAKTARVEQSEDAVLFARRAEELRLSGDALFAQGKCVATRPAKGGIVLTCYAVCSLCGNVADAHTPLPCVCAGTVTR